MVKRRLVFNGGGPKDGLAMDADFPDQIAAEDLLAAGAVNFASDTPGMAHYYAIDKVEAIGTDSTSGETVIGWLYQYAGESTAPQTSQEA